MRGGQKHVLGNGAFGEVYLAKNKCDGKFYAIKHMDKSKIVSQGAKLENIIREINIHRRLVHENIIKMYSSFEDPKSYYIVFISKFRLWITQIIRTYLH
jgi:serine/threonine protein kinase